MIKLTQDRCLFAPAPETASEDTTGAECASWVLQEKSKIISFLSLPQALELASQNQKTELLKEHRQAIKKFSTEIDCARMLLQVVEDEDREMLQLRLAALELGEQILDKLPKLQADKAAETLRSTLFRTRYS
jgi:hypothetical protein